MSRQHREKTIKTFLQWKETYYVFLRERIGFLRVYQMSAYIADMMHMWKIWTKSRRLLPLCHPNFCVKRKSTTDFCFWAKQLFPSTDVPNFSCQLNTNVSRHPDQKWTVRLAQIYVVVGNSSIHLKVSCGSIITNPEIILHSRSLQSKHCGKECSVKSSISFLLHP